MSPASCLFLLLALFLFAWGTSYKLSLYDTNPPGSVTPAKLCKLASDNAKSQVDQAIEGRKAAISDLSFISLPSFANAVLAFHRNVAPGILPAGLALLQSAPILHLRPPPATDYRWFL